MSQADLAMLAMDSPSRLRNQFGAVLVLDGTVDPTALTEVVATRLAAVPRLRQRPVPVPLGAGRPVWQEESCFQAPDHVSRMPCPGPGDETALMDITARLLTDPLPRDRPPWRATVLTDLEQGRCAVVVVLHHVLADGVGGMALLARLVDGPSGMPPLPVRDAAVRARPGYLRLARDAWAGRLRAIGQLPALAGRLRRALRAGGGPRPRAAPACSLLAPTGASRRLAVARADLAALRAIAHRHGGTVNDVVLAAVAGGLQGLLAHRGESVDRLLLGVMVTARRTATSQDPSNATTPLLVEVPREPETLVRLARIAGVVRAHRPTATGPSLATALGPVFRLLARLGAYRWYLRRQRRLHALVSNVPGPTEPVTLDGVPVTAVVPVAAAEAGDVTVSVLALSYAGTLTLTAVADADAVRDLPVLRSALQRELDALMAPVPSGRR